MSIANPTGRHLSFPFGIADDGRSRTVDVLADQVLQELQQLVLTDPGERAMLPAFGGGVTRLLFDAADANTTSLAQATLTQAIQTWLAGRAELQGVDVSASGSTIRVSIAYSVAGTAVQAVFQRNAP